MKTSLLAGNIDAAVTYFSSATAEDYRRSFIAIGPAAIAAVMNKTLTPEVTAVVQGSQSDYGTCHFQTFSVITIGVHKYSNLRPRKRSLRDADGDTR